MLRLAAILTVMNKAEYLFFCLAGMWWAWGSLWWDIKKRSWVAYRLRERRCCTSTARVSRCDDLGRADASSGHKWKNSQSKQTHVMSDSSGCAWSEIIPLFLSEGLWSTSLKGTKDRKSAKKKQQQKKLPGWDKFIFPFFFCRSAFKLNHISNSVLERSLPLLFL